jgi:uncharacterized membrane protein YqjE
MPEIEQDGRSVARVLQGIVGNIEVLVESQVGLAKVQLRAVMHDGAQAAIPLGVGVALAQLAVGLLLLAAVSALATRVPLWVAALSVGVVTAIVAVVMIGQGRRQAARVGQSPESAPSRREELTHG